MDAGKTALALSTVAVVPSIYGVVMPSMTETRATADDRGHLSAGEKYAALVAGAVVLGVAGAARSPEAALAGTVAVIGFAAAYHFAVLATP
jgi:hypothetical protein